MLSDLFAPFITAAYHVITFMAPVTGIAGAIVVFTMLVRLCMHPLARAQVRGENARAELAPKLKALQDKHKNDKERLNAELATFYGGEGKGLFAGCLPMLIQIPIFSIMYRLFLSPLLAGATLFGTPLGAVFVAAPSLTAIGLFIAIAAVATWSASRITTGPKLLRLLPYGTVVFAAFVPLAAGIYLLTTTAWTAAERTLLRRQVQPAPTA